MSDKPKMNLSEQASGILREPDRHCPYLTFSEAQWQDKKKSSGGYLPFSGAWARMRVANTMTA